MVVIHTVGIPLKKASEVDILKPLKNLITSRYQTAEQESYIVAINEFGKLRNVAVTRTLDYHENSLDTLYRYYDQLTALESKIPPSELQIPFKWKDAFDKGSIFGGRISLTVSSLSYEKVCVLFNIAALQSQIATSQSMDSDDALKLAAKLFQSAAGIINELKGIVLGSIQQEPTPDLQPDTLNALSSLMLAQAQEVIATKAISDGMKDATVAKLCAQCEEMYSECGKLMQKESLKHLWEREWIPNVASKAAQFKALAEFHQSRFCHSKKSIGEEIARLKRALELFKAAQSLSPNPSSFATEMSRAQRAYDEAVKDNDFIYHERVPEPNLLTPIGKANVVKATPVPEHFSSNFTDLFETLVPVVVQQALAAYDARKDAIVNGEIGKLRENTHLLNSILASLNLPAAIEDTRGEALPPSLREKSNAVCEKGGIQALDKLLEELPMLLVRNRELLDESSRMLQEERINDNQLRSQFGERWKRTPSEKLTSSFNDNAEKYKKVLQTAVNADSTISGKYDTHKEGFVLLSQGPDALSASLPSVTGSSTSSSSPAVQRLRGLMEKVETMRAERNVMENELKDTEFDMRDTFLRALAHDGAINEPVLSVESLGQKYGQIQKQIEDSVKMQEELVCSIQESHLEFSKSKGNDGARETQLKKLAGAHDSFMELQDNLKEGTKFYNDLTQLLVNFQSKISDFTFARRTEKEELLKDLTQGLANKTVGEVPIAPSHYQEAAKVPPPRPPPPTAQQQQPHMQQAHNPYLGAPGPLPPTTGSSTPPAQPPPYTAQPNLPYPMNPQGMPTPQGGYQYPSAYPAYTPMPQGYNPYAPPQGYPGYQQAPPQGPQAPYPQQQYPPGYPYPQQQPGAPPAQQWPPRT